MTVWINVRLQEEAHTALQEYATRLRQQVVRGSGSVPMIGRVTLSGAILFLLRQQKGHMERGRKSRQKRKEQSAKHQQQPTASSAEGETAPQPVNGVTPETGGQA